jgi:hypothetical protein
MRVKFLDLLAIALLGVPLGAAANDLYFLNLPDNQGYETWGTITTDGAAAPATADVVDYNVTVWSDALATSFTLTPLNSTFSWTGVAASPTGLTMGTDISDGWNLGSNLACTPTAFSCYGVVMFNDPITGHRLFYVVLGFGLTDEVVTGQSHNQGNRRVRGIDPNTDCLRRLQLTPAGSRCLDLFDIE